MPKKRSEIDMRNPFIPASSPVCRLAETAPMFCVALAGLAAAVIALARTL